MTYAEQLQQLQPPKELYRPGGEEGKREVTPGVALLDLFVVSCPSIQWNVILKSPSSLAGSNFNAKVI